MAYPCAMSRTIRMTYGLLAFWVCFFIPSHIVLEHACCSHDHEAAVGVQTAAAEACCEGESQACSTARCCTESEHAPSHDDTPHLHDIDGHRLASNRDADIKLVYTALSLAYAAADLIESLSAPVVIDEPIPIDSLLYASLSLRGPPSA